MRTATTLLSGLVLSAGINGTAAVRASGPVGIVGIVENVVFEPSEANAERVQLWGAFAYADGGVGRAGAFSAARKGYLYFRLDPAATHAQRQTVRNEWTDLKAVAGTGQAVGFGSWFYIAGFGQLQPDARPVAPSSIFGPAGGSAVDLRVRPASEPPANPVLYTTNIGIVKIRDEGTHAAIVRQLRDALKM